MAKVDYFEKIFEEYPSLKNRSQDFIKKFIGYKTRRTGEKELKEALYLLYDSFKQKEIVPALQEEGLSRFVYKILIKMGWLLKYRTADYIDKILKKGLQGIRVNQKSLVALFNRKFQGTANLNEQHITEIKKNVEFEKQGELPWIIYLNFMQILTALSRAQPERTEETSLEDFFDAHTNTLKDLAREARKEVEVTACLGFINDILPDFSGKNAKELKEAERKMVVFFDRHTGIPNSDREAYVSTSLKKKPIQSLVRVFTVIPVLALILCIVFFLLSRFYLLGDDFYELAREVLPSYIAGVDAYKFPDFEYAATVINDFGSEQILNGSVCYSGDLIKVEYTVPPQCYLAIICVDSAGTPYIREFSIDKNPRYFREPPRKPFFFALDNTTGLEVYYFFLSPHRFSFKRDIEPFLFKVFPGGKTKGPARGVYELDLKKPIRQFCLFFNHLERL